MDCRHDTGAKLTGVSPALSRCISPSTPPPLAAVHQILPGSTRHSYIVEYRRKHLDQGTQKVQRKCGHLSRLDLCKDRFYQGAATCCQTQVRMPDFPSQQRAMRLTCSFNHQDHLTRKVSLHYKEDKEALQGRLRLCVWAEYVCSHIYMCVCVWRSTLNAIT